jgi:HEAT repeat protein
MSDRLGHRIAILSTQLDEKARDAVSREYARVRRAGVATQTDLRNLVLESTAPRTAVAACVILGLLADTLAVGKLIRALGSSRNRLVVWEAAKALLAICPRGRTAALVRVLERGASVENRAAAAWLLGSLKETGAVDPLLRLLSSERESRVRAYAAEALGVIRDRRAHQGLVDALGDASPEVRFWASYALGRIGRGDVVPLLRKLSQVDTAEVRGLGTVSGEAKAAIRWIRSRERKGRITYT